MPLQWLPVWEQWAEHTFQRQGEDKELLIAWVQLVSQEVVVSLQGPSPSEVQLSASNVGLRGIDCFYQILSYLFLILYCKSYTHSTYIVPGSFLSTL